MLPRMSRLSIRIDLSAEDAIGPGKIRLLEEIARTGSISAAGRAMNMSYRRAWLLLDELNSLFKERVTTTEQGGRDGGGATLTPFGQELVRRYRSMESDAHAALSSHLEAIDTALQKRPRPAAKRRAAK